ncbi:cardiac-enriched FHL2-interacting protein [Hemicordylus capensis]|uniref:cardiac-enriched FHL2-interacting protein n=1 Tax=Hemicordylus capensis TaxID=884348 RepID=UPI002304618B|nr:cardiac-enriched FHL2-interacting protein [Hemicordylus capensis]XP_053165287.1 cardiac-enriched FHL2-interacting protein [Hemicordylus capensis]XP_053165288.1 cardiac-enriched FHL2-interacting protein [Hemicordylus capensis]XP_053165289.1 cardiac-enriched FHL2-interacting protein [Hemicordylus capensis]XP_053165290.1 cardiac-enriched FHL2-interacting protein [Hemicordylus capensis]XP_053165291.1 cardiac-enriched FHL2-interacting protein [Hemicordylus capensis]
MQGNKKHTDGHSDSSSLGSLLDDTDREVCNLTDRAFKSLCVAELETSYTESDPIVSPKISHQFSSKFFQGPNTVSNKFLSKTEGHSTFLHLLKDEDKKAVTNSTPNQRRKLGLPMGLRNYKHTSKVSSLIKTFDKAENQDSAAIFKQPIKNSLPRPQLICADNLAFWDGKTILNIHKELSEFSNACQDVANAGGRHERHKRHNKMDLVYQGPDSFYPSQADSSNRLKSIVSTVSKHRVKNITGKAKESSRKGHFLHSENSAFESWNTHHKKLIEMGGSTEIIPKEENLTYSKETPFFKESQTCKHKTSPIKVTAPVIVEQDFLSDAFPKKPLSQASLSPVSKRPFPPLSITKENVAQTLISPVSGLPASVSRIPVPPSLASQVPFPPTVLPQVVTSPLPIITAPIPPPSLPLVPVPSETVFHCMDTDTEKTNNSEFKLSLENVCPPWRRQRSSTFRGMEVTEDTVTEVLQMKDSLHRNLSVTPLAEMAAADSHITSSDVSSFNITKLLTPVILPKQEKESSDSLLLPVTSPMSEAGGAKESEERTLYNSQNNYKSKAPSLLFNLKDIRKRVKSTYSPSPLLRTLEDKKINEQGSIKANIIAANLLEESSKKSIEEDEKGLMTKASEQMDSTKEMDSVTSSNGHPTDNYLILNSPYSKEDTSSYQSRNNIWQDNYVGMEDYEMVSVTELPTNEYTVSQHAFSYKSEQEVCKHNVHLQGSKNKKVVPSQNADMESQICPNLFFTAEENVNNICPATGNEHRGKKSPSSSSEHSFVSILDQPFHEESFSLMQLFQKACLQESQRSQEEVCGEEKLSSKEIEKAGRKEEQHDYNLSNCCSNTYEKCERKEEQSEHVNMLEERVMKEKKTERWKSVDSVSEGKSEEPLTPTSSSSFKPNLFMIKDNTFRSSPVIKAVKLPLLRSLSCEDAIPGSHMEMEKQAYVPIQATQNLQEIDWTRNRNQQHARDAATERNADESIPANVSSQVPEKPHLAAQCTLREELQNYMGDDEGANNTAMLLHKDEKCNEKRMTQEKEKSRAGKVRPSSASQLNLCLKFDSGQNKQRSTREKENYFKNNLLSKGRGGSCVKKIITQETNSPMVSENQTCSPSSSDAFEDALATSGILVSSIIPSPRSESTVQSAFTSPLSDTTATCSTTQAAKIANSSSFHRITESRDNPFAMETCDPMQTSQLSGDVESVPVTNERHQLMCRMAKTAAKPPAVPPKTEKALRRAKKLASRRRKTEAQQKKIQIEPKQLYGDIAPSSSVPSPHSPVCFNSPLTESHPIPSLSPTLSLPATQRKLLQDPDSGEYFIVDLPIQLKTFYDPESGKYIQISIPPSKRNLSQTPCSEILSSPYVLYPTALPLRVSSVPVLASPSHLLEPASLMQGALLEPASDWQRDVQHPDPPTSQPCTEPAVSDIHSQEADESQYSFDKDVSLSANADIISMGAIEDFAIEGIS